MPLLNHVAEVTADADLEKVGTAISFMTSQLVSILGIITSSSVLCLGVAMWCIGGGISLYQRLV